MSGALTSVFARATAAIASSVTLPPVRVLITGFEPFDQDGTGDMKPNTSEALPARLHRAEQSMLVEHRTGRVIRAVLTGKVLEVRWSRERGDDEAPPGAADALEGHVRALRPHVVIATGMGRGQFTVDEMAMDLDRPNEPDNCGVKLHKWRSQYSEGRTDADTLPTSLPVAEIQRAWDGAGIRSRASSTAGMFICGDVFYRAMWLRSRGQLGHPLLAAGFVHVADDATAAEVERAIFIVVQKTLEHLDLTGVDARG